MATQNIVAEDKNDQISAHFESIGFEDRDAEGHLIMPTELSLLSKSEYDNLGLHATWKMDLVIMPCLVIMYILNYLDRQNIASAKLANIDEDLGLSSVDYQTGVSILFVGYSKIFWMEFCSG